MSKKIVVGGSTLILKREDDWMNKGGNIYALTVSFMLAHIFLINVSS